MKRAVFLDRDGVINQNREDYVKSWDEIEFLPGVFTALQRLAASDFLIFILTNQSPVGKGLLPLATLQEIHQKMRRVIESHDGRIDGIYFCPHRPEEHCDCRKPAPGMLLRAAADHAVQLDQSYFVGDARSDMQAAVRGGCRPVFVLTGRGKTQWPLIQGDLRAACHMTDDLSAAVEYILKPD